MNILRKNTFVILNMLKLKYHEIKSCYDLKVILVVCKKTQLLNNGITLSHFTHYVIVSGDQLDQ